MTLSLYQDHILIVVPVTVHSIIINHKPSFVRASFKLWDIGIWFLSFFFIQVIINVSFVPGDYYLA